MTDASRREALKLTAVAGAAALGGTLLQSSAVFAQPETADISFEQLDARIERVARLEHQPLSRQEIAAIPNSAIEKICTVYRSVRPVIAAIAEFPFLKTDWREVLKRLIAILDQICGR